MRIVGTFCPKAERGMFELDSIADDTLDSYR